eukprot:12297017-Alexandrium_andersonii.AAC.1
MQKQGAGGASQGGPGGRSPLGKPQFNKTPLSASSSLPAHSCAVDLRPILNLQGRGLSLSRTLKGPVRS